MSFSKLRLVIAITIISTTTVTIYRAIRNRKRFEKLKQKGRQKVEELNEPQSLLLQHKQCINNALKSKILSLSATQIRQEIISGNLKCIEVIITYCLQCDKANKKVNALFEKHYNSAIIDAQNLDKLLTTKRNILSTKEFEKFVANKYLLGIPISIKDVFEMKNSDSTNGILSCCNNKCNSDGSVLKVIRENGGIPFCKTSVPQLLMMAETSNNIIGDTLNPYDITRSCGGSSGGEAAIIGNKGSILGIGGDIGGSLRIPAHFSGIIAYKPSSRRTLNIGKIWAYKNSGNIKQRYTCKLGILPSVGPMARSMDDIILFLKGFWNVKTFELDTYCAPISFRDNMYLKSFKPQLNIGYWVTDGWFTPTKCVKRAIDLCVDGLSTNYNYNLIPMEFDKGQKIIEIYFKYTYAQGNMRKYIAALHGEPLHSQFTTVKMLSDIPNIIKKWIVNPLLCYFGEKRKAFLCKVICKNGGLTVKELEDTMYEIMKFRYEFWKWVDQYKLNDNNKIDVILTPVCYFPALPVGYSQYLAPSLSSTFLQNVLDCAAGSIGPITFVKHDECQYDINKIPINQRDEMSKKLNQFMKNAKSLPINVQVFGRPFHDEIVLRVMKELETLFVIKK
eukprot:394962_1